MLNGSLLQSPAEALTRPHAHKKTQKKQTGTEGQSDRESVTAGSLVAALMSHLNFNGKRVGSCVEAGGGGERDEGVTIT